MFSYASIKFLLENWKTVILIVYLFLIDSQIHLIFYYNYYWFCIIIIVGLHDQVRHVLTIITALGLVVAMCRSMLANENQVWCPELMVSVLAAHLHYVPDLWRGRAHTIVVRRQFAQLFQYTASFVVEELLSPVVTPFVLLFWLRPRTRHVFCLLFFLF